MTTYSSNRIKHMTEHEAIYALCTQRITTEQVYDAMGYHPSSYLIVEEYEKYKASCENTDLYWDERINNLKAQMATLETNKEMKILPPIPYQF